jgi:hypothetical protein
MSLCANALCDFDGIVGFVREMGGQFYLVHASQDRRKVCQSVESISVYLKNHPNMLGFNVFRPEYER